jgi:hypothetical protein
MQALFNRVAYLMLSEGVSPEEAACETHIKKQRALLRDLQRVYDDFGPDAWAERLRRVARAYSLETP